MLVYNLIKKVLPLVDRQLDGYVNMIQSFKNNNELLIQALSSIKNKKFHCQGGCAYSLYPGAYMQQVVRFITAYQTISDYLDNLCDRAGVLDEKAFRQLHLAMTDALKYDDQIMTDWYCTYPYNDDHGYLQNLVNECRQCISVLKGMIAVKPFIMEYAENYSNLQVYKHLPMEERYEKMKRWAKQYENKYPDIYYWEYAAASGSTMGIFLLYAAASREAFSAFSTPSALCGTVSKVTSAIFKFSHEKALTYEETKAYDSVYMPWICGLHILLDYLIDYEEDIRNQDLNFITYYKDMEQCSERLKFFIKKSLEGCDTLPNPEFHKTMVRGLLAMYLSDPKMEAGRFGPLLPVLLKTGGPKARALYSICRLMRKKYRL